MKKRNGKATGLVIAALVLPPLLIFGLRGLPSTDRPPVEDFAAAPAEGVCAYRHCTEPSVGLFDVCVTTGTDSQLNKTIILVDLRKYPLCERHAHHAERGRWPVHGWKFAGMMILSLGLCAFFSISQLGVTVIALLKRQPSGQ